MNGHPDVAGHRRRLDRRLRSVLGGVGVLLTVFALHAGGCATNPATGEQDLNLVGPSEEHRITAQAAPELLEGYGGSIDAPGVVRYVDELGQKLAAQSERPDLNWKFHVVDSSVVNAFALPAGEIFVSRALLERFDSEAQLAGVLGHEIGHVTAKHVGQRLTRARIITGAGAVAAIAGEATDEDWLRYLGVGTSVGGGVYLLKFGRDQESQADELGVRYMTRLGYNPLALVQVMEVFKAEGGAAGFEWLSTHPAPDTRIERLTRLINRKYPQARTSDAFRFERETYRRRALEPLKALPPPKHNPSAAADATGRAQPAIAHGALPPHHHAAPDR